VAADASWTHSPAQPRVRQLVTFDGTASAGNPPLACRWEFTNSTGSTVYQTRADAGCRWDFTQADGAGFSSSGTKYVRLRVSDGDGDIDTDLHSLTVVP